MLVADEIKDKIKPFFHGFYDSVIFSYFEGIFGQAWCDDLKNPRCALILAGDFYFLAGQISCGEDIKRLIDKNPWAVVVADKVEWVDELNRFGKKLILVDRFHTTAPDGNFDLKKLKELSDKIFQHDDMMLEEINEIYYYKALEKNWSRAFVSNFKDYEDFQNNGFGFVVTKNGDIVSGTSTFSYYNGGVEIEVSTDENYRLKGFAVITASRFLTECVNRKVTPHWDARNEISLAIAKKIGFKFKDKYTAFEFNQEQF